MLGQSRLRQVQPTVCWAKAVLGRCSRLCAGPKPSSAGAADCVLAKAVFGRCSRLCAGPSRLRQMQPTACWAKAVFGRWSRLSTELNAGDTLCIPRLSGECTTGVIKHLKSLATEKSSVEQAKAVNLTGYLFARARSTFQCLLVL